MNYLRIAIFSLFCLVVPFGFVHAATYYVDADITDVRVNSSTPDFTTYDPVTFSTSTGSSSVYKTVADVSQKSFAPGDNILFRKGQTWREQLTTKIAGTAGNQITYSSFGDGSRPRITGMDLVSSFVASDTPNIYYATITTTTKSVLVDGTLGTKKSSLGLLAANNDWYSTSTLLYVYSSVDISSKVVEVAARDKGVLSSKAYLAYDGLQFDGTMETASGWVGAGIYISGSSTAGVVINNCELKYNLYGVLFFTTNHQLGNHVISNSIIHDNRSSGVQTNAGTDGSTSTTRTHIFNNQIYNNAGFGILDYSSYWLIEHNTVYNNGEQTLTAGWSGIHVWSGPSGDPTADTGHHNIVRYNTVYGTKSIGMDGSGIGVDMYSNNNQVYNNISYGNDGPGISLASDDGNVVYNNTVYGNGLNTAGVTEKLAEIRVTGKTELDATNFTIKNNIAYATAPSVYAIYIDSYSYNNNPNITNNVFYAPNVANWYYWNNSNPPVNTVWNDLAGVGTDYYGDPKLVDVSAKDFHPLYNSPAIDAGADVGLIMDYASSTFYGLTDIGAYEYQPSLEQGVGLINPSSPFRIYADGKYRYTQATSGSATADFKVVPVGGAYPTATSSQYMDVTLNSWQASGDKNKQWTASSSIATGTVFTVGDLLPSTNYELKVDGVASSTIVISDACTTTTCTSNSEGKVTFTYIGGWSSHVFNLTKPVVVSSGGGGGGGYVPPPIIAPTSTPTSTPTTTISVASSSPIVIVPIGYEKISGPSQLAKYVSIIKIPNSPDLYGKLLLRESVKTAVKFIFKKDLKLRAASNDVKELQKFLNSKGFIVAKSGSGSKGRETNVFGNATRSALIKFQKSKKISPANGILNATTRAAINKS